jgi:cell division protein FtsQ
LTMQIVKKILRIACWVLLVTGLATVFAFVQKQENDLLCTKVNINIRRDPMKENYLVGEDAIRTLIAKRFGQIENTSLKNIDVNYLERLMYSNPWVARADVYLSIDGIVDIDIEQREPLLRIINGKNESYYLDTQGELMRWSPDFTPRVLIASGNIKEAFKDGSRISVPELINNDTLKTHTLLDDLYSMAKFILADEFWSAHVEQLYVNAVGELELVPKVGSHRIIFGDADNMTEKFWKLKTFYKEGLNYTGWANYDTLNLKFNNQVVCSKANYKTADKKTITTISKH